MRIKLLEKSKTFEAGLGYIIGNIFIKGINFITLPIFSRLMSPEEFGIYNIYLSYDSILFVLVGMALHSSVKSANYHFKKEINEYVSSISVIYLINMVNMILGVFIFKDVIYKNIGYSTEKMILLIFFSTSSALITLYNELISITYEYKKYIGVAFANAFGNVTLSLVFMLTFWGNRKDLGRIVGVTIINVFIAVYILVQFYRKAKPTYKGKYWKFGIKYCVPIIPHGVSQVLLGQFDRIMIQRIISNQAAGIYSLAGNVKLVLVVISSSISTVWSTWFFEKASRNEKETIQKYGQELMLVFHVLLICVISVGPEIIKILGGNAYKEATFLVFPMVMEAYILFLYNLIVSSEYFKQKTGYIMGGTILAALINVVTNYIFIRKYGFIAAAYTTLFSYGCYLMFHMIISYRLMNYCIVPIKSFIVCFINSIVFGILNLVFLEKCVIRYILCVGYLLIIIVIKVLWKKIARR